ncbi:MAG: chloride channel protein [Fimbriimonas sp.]
MAEHARPLLRLWLVAFFVGILAGLASAIFLWALNLAIVTRHDAPWLLFGLPLVGGLIGWVYSRFGEGVDRGNNLLLEQIHDPSVAIPFRMGPLILISTVLTHLFGGSAGREGTAVQMGGALADWVAGLWRGSVDDRRTLLMAGIAAGFGAVFGTPWAGAIFGLEVVKLGRLRGHAVVPCLVASFTGDLVARGLSIQHHPYPAPLSYSSGWISLVTIVAAGLLFAGTSLVFVDLTHWVQRLGAKLPNAAVWRPVIGGLVVVGLTLGVGNQGYNGLGIPLIERAFIGDVGWPVFALKLLFTVVTLGAGFKGGEVTPLFCIGATLGCAFALGSHQDPALFAALGFVGVFAAAANTPIACLAMGMELFGVHLGPPIALVCFLAWAVSGRKSIYPAQWPAKGE